MFVGLLHTHKLVVLLFLIIYLVKTSLLFFNKKELLASITKKIRIPEMIISTLFLLTGGVMFFQLPSSEWTMWLLIKIVVVFASIPVAIIGFKRGSKALALLSFVMIVGAYGLAEVGKRRPSKQQIATEIVSDANSSNYNAIAHGKALFTANCVACHGENGDLGVAGAKNLTVSALSDAEKITVIKKGKNAMASYQKVLNDNEINALVVYINSLKK